MADPRDRATSSAPPTLGEGCTARYDPEALSDEHGTAFPDAAQLWQALTNERPGSDEQGQSQVNEDQAERTRPTKPAPL